MKSKTQRNEQDFLNILKESEENLILKNNVQVEFPRNIAGLTTDDLTSYPCDRLDLRDMITYPIDADTTNDRDDALSISYSDGVFHLGVHISDVSSFVKHSSELDLIARERGTSIYSPTGRVIPMLPDILSQELCSLKCEDRYTITTFMDIDLSGNIINYKIVKSIIHPVLIGVYSEVNKVLAGNADQQIKEKYSSVYDSLVYLKHLSDILRERRRKNGANIAVDTEDPQITIVNGEVVLSAPDDSAAHQIVEECMIAANHCTAQFFKDNELPCVFRVQDKIKRQAFYCTHKSYHISLATDYAHTTSPIRRYPDLINQIILSSFLLGCSSHALHYIFDDELENIAETSTRRFRRAKEMQRSLQKTCYKQYLKNHQNQFCGKICGLNSSDNSIFVRMDKLNLCVPSRYTAEKSWIGRRIFFKVNVECSGTMYRAYDIKSAI